MSAGQGPGKVDPSRPSQPIVIYRLGSMGDTVVALPCFHAIARAHPHARRIVLTNFPVEAKAAPLEAILGGSGLIDAAMAYPVGTRSLKTLWALRKQLKALGSDTLYYLTPPRGLAAAWRDWVFFRCCGFKRIIGTPLSADLQANRPVGTQGELERECLRLIRSLGALGPISATEPASWDLRLGPQEHAKAKAVTACLGDAQVLAVNMGGKVKINDWGLPNWQRLLSQVSQAHPKLALLILGGPEDWDRGQACLPLWQGPVVNACGQLRPRESAAALATCTLFVGHDSGPLHLAAAVGLPCVGIFGENNPPGKWHPLGPQHTLIHDMTGVQSISVEAVLQAVAKYLQPAAAIGLTAAD